MENQQPKKIEYPKLPKPPTTERDKRIFNKLVKMAMEKRKQKEAEQMQNAAAASMPAGMIISQ